METAVTPQACNLTCSMDMSDPVPVLLHDENLLLLKIVKHGHILKRTDQLCIAWVGSLLSKPAQDLCGKVRVKTRAQRIRDYQMTGIENQAE